MSARRKKPSMPVKEMDEAELRSEVFRLQRIRAEQAARIKELESVRDAMYRSVLGRLREDFRQVIRDVLNGRQ